MPNAHRLVGQRRRPAGAAWGALALMAAAGCGASLWSFAVKVPGNRPPQNKKQAKGQLHTRANLPPVLEVPLEEPEPEPVEKEPLPPKRVPYTLHIVSHFPSNQHLHEESNARKFITGKLTDALEHMEDLIRHVEVNLQVSENFHSANRHTQTVDVESNPDEEEAVSVVKVRSTDRGGKAITPYVFKVTVSMISGRVIVLANAEKHAQPSMVEGVDHMVDVIVKAIREEKDRYLQQKKRQTRVGVAEMEAETSSLAADAEAN